MFTLRCFVVVSVAVLSFANANAQSAAQDETSLVLKDQQDIAFLYYAKSGESLDYEKFLPTVSQQFRNEVDAFKKRELLEKLKPLVEKKLAELRDAKIFALKEGIQLNAYDFDKKGFPIAGSLVIADGFCKGSLTQFGKQACYKYSNAKAFNFLPVADIERAKQFEKMRTTYTFGDTQVHFRVTSTDRKSGSLVFEIAKITFNDQSGKRVISVGAN